MDETPDSYGFSPLAMTRPCPMYEYTSRLNSGMLTSMGPAHAAIAISTHRALCGPHGCSFCPSRSHCRTRSMAPRASSTTDTTTPRVSNRIHMTRGLRRSPDTLASHPTPREPRNSITEPSVPMSTVRRREDDVAASRSARGAPVPGGLVAWRSVVDVGRTALLPVECVPGVDECSGGCLLCGCPVETSGPILPRGVGTGPGRRRA